MTLLFAIGITSTLLAPGAVATPPLLQPLVFARIGDPAADLAALQKQFSDAQNAFSELYQKATTDDERKKLIETKYPKSDEYATKAIAIADAAKGQEIAASALVWALELSQDPKTSATIIDTLIADYIASESLGDASMVVYGPPADKLCDALIAKSPHDSVKGKATFRKAEGLKEQSENTGDATLQKQAIDLYNDVIENYSGIKSPMGRLGDIARKAVYELENLGIGSVCPEISGSDVDGVKFSLADYKGKVVMLDFWGFW